MYCIWGNTIMFKLYLGRTCSCGRNGRLRMFRI